MGIAAAKQANKQILADLFFAIFAAIALAIDPPFSFSLYSEGTLCTRLIFGAIFLNLNNGKSDYKY